MLNEPINKEQIEITTSFYKTISGLDCINDVTSRYNSETASYQIWIKGSSNGENKTLNYSVQKHELYTYILDLIDHLKYWSTWFNRQTKGYKQL